VNRGTGCVGFNYRMVVIFGFGPGSPEDQGEVAPCVCPNCHNQVFLHHVRSKKSVRLYFVPVVPYGTDDYLVCPVCSRGLQLSSVQLHHVRPMASATASFRAGRLPQARYTAQVEGFWRQLGVNPGAPGPAPPPAPPPPPPPVAGPRPPPPPVAGPSVAPGPPVAAAPAPSPAADDQASWVSRLHQLARLHDQGVLSDAAYAAAKQRILDQDTQPQPPEPAPPAAS
jgi:hypothetical protein